ncbi:MAG TPA: hypothetical protein VHC48_08785 [Puia sp.]|jgi:hypothetical protein|nr:hypothetical protein [Puia sp.]
MKRAYRFIAIAIVLVIYTISVIYGFSYLKNHNLVNSDTIKTSDYISAAVAIASALTGCIAAILAYNSLLFARKAEEGKLYLSLMARYSSQDMADAFRLLSQFNKEAGENLAQAILDWKARRDNAQIKKTPDPDQEEAAKDAYALKIENARHKIKYFYRDIMQIHQAGYFSKRLSRQLLNTGGKHIFKNVVLPMDGIVNELQFKNEYHPFDTFFDEPKKK